MHFEPGDRHTPAPAQPSTVVSRVGVFSFGRVSSQRCPNKMLRRFGDTTLADLLLGKFRELLPHAFFAGHEPEFRDKCDRHGVPFVQRTRRSATIDEPIVEILAFLREQPYSHLLLVNGCLPFLRTETIRQFLAGCVSGGMEPAFAVIRRHTHFITPDRQPLNFPAGLLTINTKTVQPVLEFAHALYFFERDYLFAHGRYWDWATVRLLEVGDRLDMIDIDTEEDFAFAQTLWRGIAANGGQRPSSVAPEDQPGA